MHLPQGRAQPKVSTTLLSICSPTPPARTGAGITLPALPEFWTLPPDYLMVKYQDLAPTFFAASVATILTVFLPFVSLGEL